MTTIEHLDQWKQREIISVAQHATLTALVRKERFSVYIELNALLYVGVISLVAGLAWTFQTYFANLGDVFIFTVLSALLAGSLYYCFSRGTEYADGEVESPGLVFDYVLYFGCLVMAVELGYAEFRFRWLGDAWDHYLLLSSVIFFVLAYRFDNRFVLSLALSSLGGWFGLRISSFDFDSSESLRISGLAFGAVITVIGTFLYRQGIKKHFLETYLHIAANVIFISLLTGLSSDAELIYLLVLILLSGSAIALGVKFRRFAFVVYGTAFGYIGVSMELLDRIDTFSIQLTYVVISGALVILFIGLLARRFGREE